MPVIDCTFFYQKYFPVWLRNRLIPAGLEPFLRFTKKIMYSNFRNFSRKPGFF